MFVVVTAAVPVRAGTSAGKYYALFFFSGFPALLYQIIWQRALFTIYGVNIESVTMIVTVFMLGLGLGSLAGGWLSKRPEMPLLLLFAAIESGTAMFGICSLRIFKAVAYFRPAASTLETGLAAFFLLLLPTLLMGSTLPLLTARLVELNGNVGESVGSLYCVNTLGSAVACFAAAHILMRIFGESGSVRVAAAINACVAATAVGLHFRSGKRGHPGALAGDMSPPTGTGGAAELLDPRVERGGDPAARGHPLIEHPGAGVVT